MPAHVANFVAGMIVCIVFGAIVSFFRKGLALRRKVQSELERVGEIALKSKESDVLTGAGMELACLRSEMKLSCFPFFGSLETKLERTLAFICGRRFEAVGGLPVSYKF